MHRPQAKALVLDLDGTLVDSRLDIADACNRTLADHGREALPLPQILPMIGDGARALVARAFSFSIDDARVDAPLATFKARYLERPCVHSVLLPGAREILAVGLPSALVTNKPRDVTLLLLRALALESAFGAIRGGGDGPLKPDPSMVLSALAELGVDPCEAWFVGDGPQDMLAAKAAGCFAVYVPGIADHERVLATSPELVAASLTEVADLITAPPA
jgi:HAD superfamily hydrolase (TIGR01509 family)